MLQSHFLNKGRRNLRYSYCIKALLHVEGVTAHGSATHVHPLQVHDSQYMSHATLLFVLHVTFLKQSWTAICMQLICQQCWSYCILLCMH